MVGVGGGIFLVPALHYLFKFSQHEAQGTSIAVLVPPIGIFAALEYYRHGYVRLPVVAWLAVRLRCSAPCSVRCSRTRSTRPCCAASSRPSCCSSRCRCCSRPSELRLRTVLPTAAATGVVAILAWIDRRFGVGRRAARPPGALDPQAPPAAPPRRARSSTTFSSSRGGARPLASRGEAAREPPLPALARARPRAARAEATRDVQFSAIMPPSTSRCAPVMKDDAGSTRLRIACATSSGSP